jgi:hypothetical protein
MVCVITRRFGAYRKRVIQTKKYSRHRHVEVLRPAS